MIPLWLCCPFPGKGPWLPKPRTLALETLLNLVPATSPCGSLPPAAEEPICHCVSVPLPPLVLCFKLKHPLSRLLCRILIFLGIKRFG